MSTAPNPLVKFLGQGITFPIKLNTKGRVELESGFALIKSSILNLLNWLYTTRFFLGEYGSRLEELLEDPNDEILYDLVRYFIIESISTWEKRVELLEVTIIGDFEGRIDVFVKYAITNSQIEDSFIYPFYTKIQN